MHETGLETCIYRIECGFAEICPSGATQKRLTFHIVRLVLNWCMPKAATFTPDSPDNDW